MVRQHDQGHDPEHQEKVGAEDAVGSVRAEGEITRRVEGAEKKQHAQEPEDELAKRIEQQPASQPRERRAVSRPE